LFQASFQLLFQQRLQWLFQPLLPLLQPLFQALFQALHQPVSGLLGSQASVSAAWAAALVLGVWRKARQDAADQARLAEELGKDVTEMELFLRSAYEIPLHDVERERDLIRAKLSTIEQRMEAAGRVGKGPGDYAIGRGYLALEEPEKARAYLEHARAAGYASPALDYALGRALGELYRKALEDAKRIPNEAEREAKVKAIEAEYRDPALVHLRSALPSQIEIPAYAEGLIAYYEGRYEDALAKAKEAFGKAPWQYEAKKLEGDAEFMLGSRYRHDAAFDWDKMMAHFGPGAEAYRSAAEMARSDPEVHLSECALWLQVMNAASEKGDSPYAGFEKAKDACERAIRASSANKKARIEQALVYSTFAFVQSDDGREGVGSSDDPRPVLEEALARAEAAVRASSSDPMAHYVLGNASWVGILYSIGRGVDPGGSIDGAISAYESALRIDRRFLWALTELAQVYYRRMTRERWRGVDTAPTAQKALECADQAIELDRASPVGFFTRALPHIALAEQLLDAGRSPRQRLEFAREAAETSRALAPKASLPIHLLSMVHQIQAAYEIAFGADPRTSLERTAEYAEEESRMDPSADAFTSLGMAHATESLYLLREDKDPEPALGKARKAFERAIEKVPRTLNDRVWRARVEILGIRWAMKQRRAKEAMFATALSPLQPLLSEERDNPSLYQTMAEIHALRAAFLLEGGKTPDEDVAEGLSLAEKALSKNPHLAAALAAKGQLYLAQARAARDRAARAEAARHAKEAFDAAFRENPLLLREHGASLKEATGFL
jgi:serine/threonine-protein kinase